ncbi:MAG: ribose 5-phosphate isomerase B [Anaerolineae bacterium]|nr:ribose 5-phosphate isomerase B [Anaerolineae bacterium]
MKIAVGGDHAGFPLKGPLIDWLRAQGHSVTDHGTHSTEPVDFPDIAGLVCDQVRQGEAERGLLVCGTGVGAAIAGNKTPGIRAAVCHDVYSAHQCVEHDDVNLLCIGAQIVGPKVAEEIVSAFLAAHFSTEPHFRRRVQKLHELERRSAEEILSRPQD